MRRLRDRGSASPEFWGIWSAPLFAVNFTVICVAAWRVAVFVRRVGPGQKKRAGCCEDRDCELDG